MSATLAHSQFSGAYAPSNWTTKRVNSANSNATLFGTVNTSGAPASIVIKGSDGYTDNYASITYSILVNQTGTVKFNYSISNEDVPGADFLFWGKNNTRIDSVGPAPTGNGTVTFPITAGQTLVIGVSAIDDQLGSLTATISNFSISGTVPVKGSPLSVSKDKTARLLNWTTFVENNNKGFELQRSYDAITFSTIEFINSAAINGNSDHNLAYTYRDISAAKPAMYYRYKQIDLDGNQSYSNVVFINDATAKFNTALNVAPNPVMNTQIITLNNTLEGTLLLYNAQGVLVYKEMVGKMAKVKLPIGLSSGTYFTVLKTLTIEQSATIVVQ